MEAKHMIFSVTDKQIRSDRRKSIIALLVVIVIIAAAASSLIAGESLNQKAIAVVILFVLTRYLIRAYKNFKHHDSSYPTVEIFEPAGKIEISNQGTTISIPLSDIEGLRIQSSKGNIKSLLLTTKSFSNLRFEGYENLALMADLLKKHTPDGKVKIATWYHR